MSSVTLRIFWAVAVVLFFTTGQTALAQSGDPAEAIGYIEPDPRTSTSMATKVGDVALAFTRQVFPVRSSGELVEHSDLGGQVDQVLRNLDDALKAAGTHLGATVRLHVYLADDSLAQDVQQQLRDHLPDGAYPAVTYVSGEPPRSGVLVSMDAVAVAPDVGDAGRPSTDNGGELKRDVADVAVLSSGRKIFVAGQAERAEDHREATRRTMQSLLATLAYAGATARDIVQVKAFAASMQEAEAVEDEIAGFFHDQHAPPIVTLEWRHDSFPVEIELVASAPPVDDNTDFVRYYAPPWLDQATTFSRLVDVHKGGLLFTSGLYGEEGEDGEDQARTIFNALSRLLDEAGSDFDHLVKGTYYPSTNTARQGLVDVRTQFFNPDRPPAASLAAVEGVGRLGSTLNLDMISVIPDPPEKK